MAGDPFDREIINVRERPLSSDVNAALAYMDRTMRYALRQPLLMRSATDTDPTALDPLSGFIGDGFRVRASAPVGMSVVVLPGLGWQDDATSVPTAIDTVLGLDDVERYKPLPLLTAQTLAVPAADPANPRIDIIEVRYRRERVDSSVRGILNIATGKFDPTAVLKTLKWLLDSQNGIVVPGGGDSTSPLSYKTGTAAAVPAAPAATAGYVKIAEVYVDAAAVSIAQNKVTDFRPLLFPHGTAPVGLVARKQPALSVDSIVAPPGVQIGVVDNTFSNLIVYVVVPNGGTYRLNRTVGISSSGGVETFSALTNDPVSLAPNTAGPVEQAAMAAATPAIQIAEGGLYFLLDVVALRVENGGLVAALTTPAYTYRMDLVAHLRRTA